jgi:choline dehydrogenase-like flavoprotein
MSETTFDYIIIGAGTAGSLLANRLSADASNRVLLIEAGRKDDYHWIHIPVGYLYCIGNPRTDWLYNTEPAAGLNGRTLRYPRGKTLGGCSSINGMIYMRGQARDYDQWAQLTGDETWSWRNTLPWFKLHEDHYKGANAAHGAKGTPSELLETPGDAADAVWRQVLRHHQAGGEWRVEKQRLRWGRARRLCAGRAGGRHCGHRRLQPRRQRRRGLLRGQPARRLALEHGQSLPAPDLLRAPQFRALDIGAGRPTGGRCAGRRPEALHRRTGLERPRAGHGDRHARGHPLRGLHRYAADPAALGHRVRRIAATARHCTGA